MSMEPMFGVLASAAGSPLVQSQAAEIDRVRRDGDARRVDLHRQRQADAAAGVAACDGEEKAVGQGGAERGEPWLHSPPARPTSDARSAVFSIPFTVEEASLGSQIDLLG